MQLKHARKAHEAAQTAAKKDEDMAREKMKQHLKLNLTSTSSPGSQRRDIKASPKPGIKLEKVEEKAATEEKKVQEKEEVSAKPSEKEEKAIDGAQQNGTDDAKADDVKEEDVEDDRDQATPTLETQVHLQDTEDSDTEPIEEGPEIPVEEMSKLRVEEKEGEKQEEKKEEEQEKVEQKEEVKDEDAATPNDAVEDDVFAETEQNEAAEIQVEDVQDKDNDASEPNEKDLQEKEEPPQELKVEENGVQDVAEPQEEESKEIIESSEEQNRDVVEVEKEEPESVAVTSEEAVKEEEEVEGTEVNEVVQSPPPEAENYSSILMPVKLYEESSDPLDYYYRE